MVGTLNNLMRMVRTNVVVDNFVNKKYYYIILQLARMIYFYLH